MNHYGIDVNKLDQLITTPILEKAEWGSRTVIMSRDEFSLERIILHAGKSFGILLPKGKEATIFIENGIIRLGIEKLEEHDVFFCVPGQNLEFVAEDNATVYIFLGKAELSTNNLYGTKQQILDHREKYWGSIGTIVSKSYAGKRIFCRRGEHASLEFHCQKKEAYFVHSGKLLVRLRAGRAEDRYFEMAAGTAIFIPQGLMHQRGGLSDTVIIEISTQDKDSDSFLVEDGQKIKMPNLPL